MTEKYETSAAAAVIGLAGFQLLQLWGNTAPSLSDMRMSDPNDTECRKQLQDADILVGSIATVLGVTFAIMTKDATALFVMLIIFGANSYWYHRTLNQR